MFGWPPPTARIAPPVTVYSVGKALMRGDLVFMLAWSPHAMMIGRAAATPSIGSIGRPHPPHSPHFHAETQQTSHRDHTSPYLCTITTLSPPSPITTDHCMYEHHHHRSLYHHCITTVSPPACTISHHRWRCTGGECCRSLYN